MTVDNDMISVFITNTKLCYLCVSADEQVVRDSVVYTRHHRLRRSILSLGWNANFTQNISPSHIVILTSHELCESLLRFILQQQ